MQTSTFKTSTIFVATGKRTRVFQSLEDVPSGLRERLSSNLSGPNTRTLIVADRRGREYLLKVLQRATGSASLTRPPAGPVMRPVFEQVVSMRRLSQAWSKAKRYWLEIALIGFLGATGWALFYAR